MRKAILTIVVALGMASQAAAKPQYRIQIRPAEGQVENWKDGFQYVDDEKSSSLVRIVSIQDRLPDKQSTFRVYVLNKSDKPITFGPENVTIEYADGKRVTMFTYQELAGRLRRDVKRRQGLALLGRAFSAQAADGRTTGSFDYSGTTSYGTRVSGSGTYTAYDPVLARQQQQAVQEQSAATDRAIQARQFNGTDALDRLIQRSTIQPGGTIGGVVAYDAPASFKRLKKDAITNIVVSVGEENHRIPVQVSQIR